MPSSIQELLTDGTCLACHGMSQNQILELVLLHRISTANPEEDMATIPYLQISQNASITTNPANTVIPITFSDIDLQYQVGFTAGGSMTTIQQAGVYLMVLSGVVDIIAPFAGTTMNTWLRVNGINVPRSNTRVVVSTDGLEHTLAVGLVYRFNIGDTFDFCCLGNRTSMRFVATAAVVGPPAIPACPSVILTVNKVSD